MKALIQRSSFHRFATGRGRFGVIPLKSLPLVFQSLDGLPQPVSRCFFNLVLIAIPIQRIQSLSRRAERDVPAGNLFRAELGWHQLHQDAIAARSGVLLAIIVHAGGGILEDKLGSPGLPGGTPISALLQEFELKS
jgi:hypothetical protein